MSQRSAKNGVIFSESLEEEGKVSWAAEISKHVVEETDSVQNLGLQFTQAICQDLFYLELAHVGTVPHLLLLEETKEGLPLLQAGRQTLVPRNPVGGQLKLLLKEWKSRKTPPSQTSSTHLVGVQLLGGGDLPQHLLGAPRHTPTDNKVFSTN